MQTQKAAEGHHPSAASYYALLWPSPAPQTPGGRYSPAGPDESDPD